jgi:hypothetical protein
VLQLSFYPPTIASRSATLEIRGTYRGHDLTWVFPIKGIAEAPMQRRAFSIHCAGDHSLHSLMLQPLYISSDRPS